MTRLDRTRVFVTNFTVAAPVFHRAPHWPNGEGCHGGYYRCNRNTLTGRSVELPDHVNAPCGMDYLALLVGANAERRPEFEPFPLVDTNLIVDRARMRFRHPLGGELPRGHAEKFARPCRRCFPKGDA